MTQKAHHIYEEIQSRFLDLLEKYQIDTGEMILTSKGLSTEEAIGITERKDYPILTGMEIMLQAEYKGSFGQAFTDAPSEFHGSLADILKMDLCRDAHARGLYFAAMNAVLKHLGLIGHTVHCRTKEPAECAPKYIKWMKQQYSAKKIALIGYQPSLFQTLSDDPDLTVRCLDLNPDNVGQIRFGVKVEHGINDYSDAVLDWADLVLCTSSVFANATMDYYIAIDKPVLFFGITGAAPIYLLGLSRYCPLSQ